MANKIITSKSSTQTPLEMVIWVNENFKNMGNTLNIKVRTEAYNVTYNNFVYAYEMITDGKDKISKTVKSISMCNKEKSSFVFNKYNMYILSNLNKKLKNEEIEKQINDLRETIEIKSESHISNDLKLLNKIFEIKISSNQEIEKQYNDITGYNILKFDVNHVKKCIQRCRNTIKFYDKLQPYFNIYYTIRELDLEANYVEFITRL